MRLCEFPHKFVLNSRKHTTLEIGGKKRRGSMKFRWNLSGRVFGLACLVVWIGLQVPVVLLSASGDQLRSFADTNVSLNSSCAKGPTLNQATVSKASAAESYGSLPLSFEA